jgi:hypothetical protein
MYYKLICLFYALLCGQNFILVKSGCYKEDARYPEIEKLCLCLFFTYTKLHHQAYAVSSCVERLTREMNVRTVRI